MCLPTISTIATKGTNRLRRSPQWLFFGPLLGGILTHLWDLAILNRHAAQHQYRSEIIYAVEVAPYLERNDDDGRRRKRRSRRSVQLDDFMESSRDDFSSQAVYNVRKRSRRSDWSNFHHSDRQDEWRDEERHEKIKGAAPSSPQDFPEQEGSSKPHKDCIPMHSWQTTHHPMCNTLHEMDFQSNFLTGYLEYIDSGGFNDLFHYMPLNTTEEELAVKILRFDAKDYTPRNYQIVRHDAVIQERLSSSPYIFDIYGYCGFALVLPFVSGGTISSHLRKWRKGEIQISSKERLRYAVDMARGLRDLHDIDLDGVPSVTHGDLKEQQYLITKDGGLQLGDFNKGAFLLKSQSTGETCKYVNRKGHNDKVFRSPEEYAYKPQTAATDVWALGSLMYYLLTGARVWRDLEIKDTKLVQRYIVEGRKPEIKEEVLNSRDPVDIALKRVYDMACVYEPEERASAREISDYLDEVWKELGY